MLHNELFAVCSDIHTNHTKAVCEQNMSVEFFKENLVVR